MSSERELRNSIEFLPGRLYYVPLSGAPAANPQKHFFSIDNELIYWNFFLDFGPLNLGQTYRFCALLNNKLSDSRLKDKIIYFYSGTQPQRRANAAFLISAWAMLCLDKSPEDAFAPFRSVAGSFPPWHDATPTICTFNLTILDTLKGLHKARECKFFDFKNFNIDEYEHFEKVENGDLSWCMDGKFIAFAGPHATRETSPGGYQTLCPENYIPYFKRKNVTLVVRLNKKYYDAKKFTSQGIDHVDMYFLDGSNPPQLLLRQFIQRSEETRGAVAVHCKAGLGRTGTCIGCYFMKHFRFTAEETIGWLRIVRPGSIIGPQQDFMREMEQPMWREGEVFRTRLSSLTPPGVDSEEQREAEAGAGAAVSAGIGQRPGGRNGALSVRSGSNNQLLTSQQAAAMAKEEEGNSQGDHLRARRQMKGSESPMSPGGAMSPAVGAPPVLASSPLARSGSRTFTPTNSATLPSTPGKAPSIGYSSNVGSSMYGSNGGADTVAPTTPPPSSSSASAPSPTPGAPHSPASPTKRKSTLGTFLGLH